jgi:hypothetical protein
VKRQPPYYELDHETRRFAELMALYAERFAAVQQNDQSRQDILEVIYTVCERLGLDTGTDDEPEATGEIVLFPKFRVIKTEEPTNSE